VFTGIIQEVGEVRGAKRSGAGGKLTVNCPKTAPGLKAGDSVAVNGACLTCEEAAPDGFTASVLLATYEATNLGELTRGDHVNLEPALRAGDRLGGHFLQGHVDCAVRVIANEAAGGEDWTLTCELPDELAPMVFPGASIGLNGVSLTVRTAGDGALTVSLIPATLEATNLGALKAGGRANCEVDLIVKSVYYAVRQMGGRKDLSLDDLARLGYGR
jgi:riboflavin synthase